MKAVLVGVKLDNQNQLDFEHEMEELKNLATACNIESIETVTQNLDSFHPVTYIGKGKVEEIKMVVEASEADVVIFNDELSPIQISNLQDRLDVSIFDRTYLILEIFKSRAKTREAIIQVEIASLNYMLPRLVGLRQGLSRQRGTGGGFAHGRGAGESKLELDRRINKDKITALKRELVELSKTRKQQREKRKKNDVPTVCLVGYTNSGKSTLMNCLLEKAKSNEEKKVFQKDMLFATLETSSRRISLEEGNFILTATVGFIEKLPHNLIEAFKSTLEEITEANLIVHVVDGSNEKFLNQISATNKVLEELGVDNIPIIYAFNKIDKVEDYLYIPNDYPEAVRISALNKTNIDYLIKVILEKVYCDYVNGEFYIPYGKENIMFKIKESAIFVNVEYLDDGILLKCKTNEYTINKYQEYQKK